MSPAKLDALKDSLAKQGTKSLLIIRHDKIVYEWYAAGHGAQKKHYTASLVKAIVAGILFLLGWQDGRFEPEEPVAKYVTHWKNDPHKSKITFRHLATHSSGLSDAEHNVPGWEESFWKRRPDPFTVARDQAPMLFAPGQRFEYSNPGIAMLAYGVTASYGGKPGTDQRSLLKKRIMDPIGVPASEWSMGYGQTYKVDNLDLVANWGGGSYTARAVAHVGRLMLRKGDWQGKQLLDPKLIDKALTPSKAPIPQRSKDNPQPASGLGWWLNRDGVWPSVPRDAFAGAGAGH
ncbi:MAG: serine hydrolase, partial [Gemmataceae bacterium]|nr:serine hydrolase [Gemmataceae bacterium]